MAFLLLGAFGYTINMMVMFGMVIAVGILVDGAIVVTEYADRKMAEGLNRKEAYGMAGKRMFWPVVASTAGSPHFSRPSGLGRPSEDQTVKFLNSTRTAM